MTTIARFDGIDRGAALLEDLPADLDGSFSALAMRLNQVRGDIPRTTVKYEGQACPWRLSCDCVN